MNKIGFYAGSFDPFTRGHLSIVCEALCLFDKVIVGIGSNPSKRPVFDLSERQSMIRQTFEDWQDSFRYCRPADYEHPARFAAVFGLLGRCKAAA